MLQPSYELKATHFQETVAFRDCLQDSKGNQITLVFAGKTVNDYYQKVFSRTDLDLCKAVFSSIEDFSTTKVFLRNNEIIENFVRDASDDSIANAGDLLTVIRDISNNFSSISVLNVQRSGKELELSEEHLDIRNKTTSLDAAYLEKIEKQYLKKFHKRHGESVPDGVFFGVDQKDGYFDLEIHLSNHYPKSRVFILRYDNDSTITKSVLSSIQSLFSAIHIRFKKSDYQADKASYVTQVRHATVNHLSAAQIGLIDFTDRFEKGFRSSTYWNNIRNDPVLQKNYASPLWSLEQARSLLESGQFIVEQVDDVGTNRKVVSIISIVSDCFKTLDFIRKLKKLTVKSKIVGAEPKITANKEYLSIAVMNLIDNAMKYSHWHKQVTWEIIFEETSYTFKITNLGEALPEADREILLGMFRRGKQSSSLNARHGTGLGLPVADKLLRAHYKECVLDYSSTDNNPEFGGPSTTFSFTMPYFSQNKPDESR